MKGSALDLFDPRTASMESDNTPLRIAAPDADFGFAFNDSNFSDRVLRIEMVADPTDARTQSENCWTLADWAARKSKRRRGDIVKKENAMCHTFTALDINVCPEEHCQQFDVTDLIGDEKCEEDRLPTIGDSSSGDEGDEAADSDDSNSYKDVTRVLTVKTLHISSPILAAKSPFFYKLFSNGMKESEQRHVTLRIYESEEAAFMELLNFMYTGTLSTDTAPQLLDVLIAADKFEVASCIRHCCHMLTKLPMTSESALVYLDLPFSILMTDAVQPLIDAAKTFLAACYKDITRYQDDAMKLPLVGIEAILSSDDLLVGSEDAVYDFVLKWARLHYPKAKERRDILCSRLGRYIRFPYMTCRKLKKLLSCNDFDHEFATRAVLDALFFKTELPHRQRTHTLEESTTSLNYLFKERAYKYKPLKVVEFELPRPQCLVYLDLNREECGNLFPSGRVYSQAFHVGGQGFFLSAHCNIDQQSSSHCFGLFLGMQEKGSVKFAIDYEFSVRSKATEEFVSKYKGNYTFTGGKAVGYRNLFSIPWTSFMADDSLYFINGTLHLRAELTIKN